MKNIVRISLMLFAGAFVAAGAFAAESNSSRKEFADRYSVISDRNMFLRDRSKPTSRPAATSRPSREHVAEEYLVVRGIVAEDEGFRAYIEDTRARTMQKLVEGDSIGRGKIATIEMDAVEFEQGGKKSWIPMGHDLTGRVNIYVADVDTSSIEEPAAPTTAPAPDAAAPPTAAATVSPAPTAAPTAPPTAAPAKLEGDPSLSAEQRMKLRRAAELKK